MEPTAPKMYPTLELPDANSFRLGEIATIRARLRDEVNGRARTLRRYKTSHHLVHGLNTAACTVGAVTGAGSVGTVSLGIVIAAIPLAAISLCSGVLAMVTGTVQKILLKKLEKHVAIHALAEGKLATINALVAKALEDKQISDSEFKTILREDEDFNAQKRALRLKVRKTISTDIEGLKKEFLAQGRQMGWDEAKAALNKQ